MSAVYTLHSLGVYLKICWAAGLDCRRMSLDEGTSFLLALR